MTRSQSAKLRQLALALSTTIEPHTIGDAVERFRAEEAFDVRSGTLELYQRALDHIERACRGRQCEGSFRAVAVKFHRDLAPSVANRACYMLGRLLRLCLRWGWRSEPHDLDGLTSIRSAQRTRVLTLPERRALLLRVAKPESPRQAAKSSIVAFLLRTGWRVSEACSLEWAWVDWASQLARLPVTKTVPQERVLGGEALEILSAQPRSDRWVWPAMSGKTHVSRTSVTMHFGTLCRELDIHGAVLHSTRHTFCTVATQLHIPASIVAAAVGHGSAYHTLRYSHPSVESVHAATAQVEYAIAKAGRS